MHENGVSDTIGIILLVALTVIIASIIAAYIFGVAGNIEKTKTIAATAERKTDGNIFVTYHGGSDSGSVSEIIVYRGGTEECRFSTPETGVYCTFQGSVLERDHITVAAKFYDADPQVILDVFV